MVLLAVLLSVNKASMRLDWRSVKKAFVLKAHFYFFVSLQFTSILYPSKLHHKIKLWQKSTHTNDWTKRRLCFAQKQCHAIFYSQHQERFNGISHQIVVVPNLYDLLLQMERKSYIYQKMIRNLAECPLFSCLQLYFNWSFIWNFGQCF